METPDKPVSAAAVPTPGQRPTYAGFGDWREEAYYATQFNVHRATWRRWALRAGLRFRRLGQKRFYRERDVAELMETGVAPINRRKAAS